MPAALAASRNRSPSRMSVRPASIDKPSAPAAVIADVVAILSNNWTDAKSFKCPVALVHLPDDRFPSLPTFNYGSPHNVYDDADRNFTFDEDFLQPGLLPPGAPMFRDVNLLTFTQTVRPNQ